jgi:hypothetical protein
MSLLELASPDEIEAQIERRRSYERVAEVAFLGTPIGPGRPWPGSVNWRKSFPLPFPAATVPAELVMAKLVADPKMLATLEPYDIALLDTSERRRSAAFPQGLYVIERSGEAVLRYIRSGTHCYYLVTDSDLNNPTAWEQFPMAGAQLSSVLRARVLWLGRELDRDVRPQRGRFLYDPISW